jgi:hypothetical protein
MIKIEGQATHKHKTQQFNYLPDMIEELLLIRVSTIKASRFNVIE